MALFLCIKPNIILGAINHKTVLQDVGQVNVMPRHIIPFFACFLQWRIRHPQRIAVFLYLHAFASYGLDKACLMMADHFRGMTSWLLKGWFHQLRMGKSLSTLLGQAPNLWGDLVPSMVKSGEKSGQIRESLQYSYEYYKAQQTYQSHVTQAMIYPALIASVMGVTLWVMATMFLPSMEEFFLANNKDIPIMARGLKYCVSHGLFIVLTSICTFLGVRYAVASSVWGDKCMMYVPFLGHIRCVRTYAAFFHHLHFFSQRHMNIWQKEGDRWQGKSPYINQVYNTIIGQLAQGIPLSKSIGLLPRLPRVYVQSLALGEKGGKLPETFTLLHEQSQQDLNRCTQRVIKVCEPLLIIGLGCVFVLILYGTLLPLYGGFIS